MEKIVLEEEEEEKGEEMQRLSPNSQRKSPVSSQILDNISSPGLDEYQFAEEEEEEIKSNSILPEEEGAFENVIPRVFTEGKIIIREEKKYRKLFGYFSFNKKKNPQREQWKKAIEMDEHVIPIKELLERYGTDLNFGLTPKQIQEGHAKYGRNELKPPKQLPGFVKFLKYIFTGFNLLLLFGSALSFLSLIFDKSNTQNLALGVLLVVIVFIGASFEYYQEAKSSKVMKGFVNLTPQQAVTIRNKNKSVIDARDLTCGDIVELKAGNKVPADVRILESNGLKVDNSSLTGESDPQTRSVNCTHDNPLETHNLAFYTTLITDGTGLGIVVNVGQNTVIGRIANLAISEVSAEVPLKKDINHFIKFLSIAAISIGIIFFSLGFISFPFSANVAFAIGIIVANVPEGLPPTVTLSLTLTAKRLASKNILAKNLVVVETLGSCSTICSDKTGTLTMNRMSVAHLWLNGNTYSHDTSTTEFENLQKYTTFLTLQRIATLCNKAVFDKDTSTSHSPKVIGDASETALLRFFNPLSDMEQMREENPKVFDVPFNSERKFQFSIHKLKGDNRLLLVIKGAPDRLIPKCNSILIEETVGTPKVVPFDTEWKKKYDKEYEQLGGKGERVLAFAQAYLDPEKFNESFSFQYENGQANFPIDNYCLIGLISLIDPPRPEVPAAIDLCRSAGVKVFMVTGDHPLTASAIAKQVGILTEEIDKTGNVKTIGRVVTGTELEEMSTEDLKKVFYQNNQIVFARTSPQQKLKIVETCQATGEVVAVTGDGVNDSPALKKADIGIAMGINGSDVSKEAADMILMDDNFASIVKGIQEGRIIFDNLKKSVAYTLTSNVPESIPFLFYIIFELPLPASTILILFIDLVADLMPAISFAYEEQESDIMKRGPRNVKKDRLINRNLLVYAYLVFGFLQVLSGFTMYFVVLNDRGYPPLQLFYAGKQWIQDIPLTFNGVEKSFQQRTQDLQVAQSAYFLSILMMQSAILWADKTRRLSLFKQGIRNYWLILGFFQIYIVAVLIIYVPFLNEALGSQPVPGIYWTIPLPFMVFTIFYDEIRKLIIRKFPRSLFTRCCNW